MVRKNTILMGVGLILLSQLMACGKQAAAWSSTNAGEQPPVGSSSTPASSETPIMEEAITSVSSQNSITDKTDGTILLNISVVRPTIANPSGAGEKINAYYDKMYEEKEKNWEGELAGFAAEDKSNAFGGFTGYSVNEDYEVMLETPELLSIKRVCETYMGGAHGSQEIACDTFNRETGQRLTLQMLFPNVDVKELLLPSIQEQLAVNTTDAGYYPEAEQLVADLFTEDSFWLSKEGLVIVYQPYDIAPYAAGPQFFTIPWATLHDKMNSTYWELLNG